MFISLNHNYIKCIFIFIVLPFLVGMHEKRPFLSQNMPDGPLVQDAVHRPPNVGVGGRGVPLGPSWEERNVPDDQLNFRTLSVSMDRLDLEMNPPEDR